MKSLFYFFCFRAEEGQWQTEWAELVSSAGIPRSSLEQTHVWVLAHVLRRPIIVYAVHSIKNYRDEVQSYINFCMSHRGLCLFVSRAAAPCLKYNFSMRRIKSACRIKSRSTMLKKNLYEDTMKGTMKYDFNISIFA